MDEQKNNLMIFSIVGVVAIVAISLFFMSSRDTVKSYSSQATDLQSDISSGDENLVGDAKRNKVFCEDSDGSNLGIQGSVRYNDGKGNPPKIFTDYCLGRNIVEGICSGDKFDYFYAACASGKDCEQGVCVTSRYHCLDSDGGLNYYVPGRVEYGLQGFPPYYYLTDICIDGKTISENYCEYGSYATTIKSTCPNFCVTGDDGLGKCSDTANPPSCTDTDGGMDYIVKGTTTSASASGTESKEDSCGSDGSTLQEFYCGSDGKINNLFVNCRTCEAGTINCQGSCKEGRCKNYIGPNPAGENPDETILSEGGSCTDTDGGFAPSEFGTASGNGQSQSDFCVNEQTLAESWCTTSGQATSSYTQCAGVDVCAQGVCTGSSDGGSSGGNN